MQSRAWKALATLAGLVLGGCVVYVHDSDRPDTWNYKNTSTLELFIRPESATPAPDGGAPIVGTWKGDGTFMEPPLYSQRYYALEVRSDDASGMSRRTEVRSLDDVEGLPVQGKEYDERSITLRLRRDAGVIVLNGEKNGKHAEGNVRFEKDAAYAALASDLAGREVDINELAALGYANVKRTDLEDLKAAKQTLTPRDVIRLRDQGISGKFIRELSETGRVFSIDEAIKLRNNGVSAEYVKNLRQAGLDASTEDLVRLHNNGVGSAFVKALAAPDGKVPEVSEIIRLRNSGVSAEYISNLRAAGYSFSTEEVIRLNNSSISSGYAKAIRECGYDLSVDQLIRLRNSGVSAQYVRDLQDPGYEKMSIDQIIDARNKGLSADFVKKLRKRE